MAISRAFAILIALAVITFPMQAFKIATSTIRPYFARSSAGIARSMVSSLSKKSVTSSAMEVDTPSARVLPVLKAVRPKVLFVLGGPGAGKGTQCEMLSNEYGMKHLSAGELLREEINSGSANGKLIDGYLKEGKIVPVKITLDLLREKMETTACNRFLVDGFPRNWDNVQGWESCMTEVCDIEAVMFIDCPEEELERRLLSRGKTSGRSDDNLTTARKRFATFKESTMPVVEHYEGLKKLVRVRGDQAIDAVFRDMKAAVAPFVEGEILELTDSLLKAISNRDWDAYKNLCDPSLTAFEGEAKVRS